MYPMCVCFVVIALSHGYVNIALNKPAYQQYPLLRGDETIDAGNAVDGRKSNLSSYGDQCVSSAPKETAIWWVNLNNIHSIHHITIYFMTDNLRWESSNFYTSVYLGFSVYVSNTTDRLQGTLCYKDDNFTRDTIPAVFTTICPVHGQYVIFYNERLPGVTYPDDYSGYAYTDLCEVEIFGYPIARCSVLAPDGKFTSKNWKTEFIGVLGGFCILLVVIGVALGMFLINRNSRTKFLVILQSTVSRRAKKQELSNFPTNETSYGLRKPQHFTAEGVL
ncbi:uncharacterized protein [Magallana gigas]|uniref:uncharacterized protein n=1 Tax=Magallana gigas TaxID=29159 RepID=UPI003341F659